MRVVKKKLTMTIDEVILQPAKGYARWRGVSLSKLIEESLRQLRESETQSVTERWKGKFHAANRDDERYDRLARKFL
jgi:hypothetical protein